MNWFKKLVPSRITTKKKQRVKSVPEGVWVTCDSCGAQLYRAELERNLNVCIKCDHHMRIPARERLRVSLIHRHLRSILQTLQPMIH